MSKTPVLVINSYAGSLVMAAQQEGHPIVGSLEDAGYGLPIQRENFPQLSYHPTMASWPTRSLKDHVVLAHPPCAAFSNQNNSVAAQGVDAKKFQCTVAALGYALGHRADAVCVESVTPALEGAREVHDQLARQYRYDLYRVLQNAATFNLAQWRPRFWAIFVRRGLLRKRQLTLSHDPEVRLVRDVVAVKGPRTLDNRMLDQTTRQVAKLTKLLGRSVTATVLHGEDHGLAFMVAGRAEGLSRDGLALKEKYGYPGRGFNSSHMRIIHHLGFATTLLYDAWWWDRQAGLLSREEYLDIMGFPRTYRFPENLQHRFREFLSRGVCPPVARWVLNQVTQNLEGKVRGTRVGKLAVLKPGETANFLVPLRFKDQAAQLDVTKELLNA